MSSPCNAACNGQATWRREILTQANACGEPCHSDDLEMTDVCNNRTSGTYYRSHDNAGGGWQWATPQGGVVTPLLAEGTMWSHCGDLLVDEGQLDDDQCLTLVSIDSGGGGGGGGGVASYRVELEGYHGGDEQVW